MSDKLAIVTGASTGIGFELARCCARDGINLLICANEPEIEAAAKRLRSDIATVETVQADLGHQDGIDALCAALNGRRPDYLLANAGVGLGKAFLDQSPEDISTVMDTNVTGTTLLLHRIGKQMRDANSGRILITGSIAGFMPGSYQAVYNASKAYLDSLSYALRNELNDTNITVTCLMPGPTATAFFRRAGMENTPVGQEDDKADAAKVAQDGYSAMMAGKSGIVSGLKNKMQAGLAGIIPDTVLARMHRRMAKPESGSQDRDQG